MKENKEIEKILLNDENHVNAAIREFQKIHKKMKRR